MHDEFQRKLRQALPQLTVDSFVYLDEGQDNMAFEINGSLIVRFTKRGAAALEQEAAILDFVQAISPLPTPVLKYKVPKGGFIGYDKLPGVPLITIADKVNIKQWPDFAAQLGNFMSVLNSADIEPVKRYLPTNTEGLEAWLKEAKECFSQVQHIIPQVYHAPIQEFLATPVPNSQFESTFAHNDLGIEHILVDSAAQRITGIIDWGDAAIADPAHDFGKIFRDLGPEVFQAVLRAYTIKVDSSLQARAAFYARCGVLEDLAYGAKRQSHEYIHKCLASLPWLFS